MADKTTNMKTKLAFEGEAEYKKACKEINSNLKLLNSEMKLVTAEYKNNENSIEALKAKQDVLQRIYAEQAKKVEETEKALKAMIEAQGENSEGARRLETALNQQRTALVSTRNALSEIEQALENTAQSADDFGNEVEESGAKAEGAQSKLEGLKSIGSGLAGVFAGLAAGATALGGALVAGLGYSVNAADEAKGAINDFMAATGEATEKTEEYRQVMENIYNSNFGEGFEDIAAAMREVKQQAGDIGAEELESMTTNALMLRDTFEFEVNESVRAAEMLMKQFGLSSTEAYNLIAQGAQNGLNKNGDLLDVVNEYAVHYKNLGFSAEDFFNSLDSGTAAGTFSVDKLGDAMKEFGIRVRDGSDTTAAAFEILGYDAEEMFKMVEDGSMFAEGGIAALIDELAGMPDSIEKTTAGVALFGTMWEDLGAEGIQALSQMNGEISLTTDALGQINSVKYDTFGEAMGGLGKILQTNFVLPLGNEALPIFTEFANTLANGAVAANGDMSALADTFSTAIGQLTSGINEMIPTITTMATEMVAGLVSCAPQLMSAGVELIDTLIVGLVQAIPQIAESAVQIIDVLIQGIIDLLPTITEGAVQLIVSLAQGIAEALPELVPQIVNLMLFIVETLVANIPTIISAASEIIVGLATGLVEALPMLAERLPEIIAAIITGLVEALPMVIESAGQVIVALATGLVEALPILIESLPQIAIAIIEGLAQALPQVALLMWDLITQVREILKELPGKIWDSIISAVTKMANWGLQMQEKAKSAMSELLTKIVNVLRELPTKIWNTIISCVTKIAEWGLRMKEKAKSAIKSVADSILNGLKDLPNKIMQIGSDIVGGIWSGLQSGWSWLTDKVKGLANTLLTAAKEALGIHSPSRKFRDLVGVPMAQGIGVGFSDEMGKVSKEINDSIPQEFDLRSKVNIEAETAGNLGKIERTIDNGRAAGVTIIQNIYAQDTSYKAQQKEAAKQFKSIAREVYA